MINRLRRLAERYLTPVLNSPSQIEANRAQVLLVIGLLGTIGGIGFLLLVYLPALVNSQPLDPVIAVFNLSLMPIGLLIYFFTRSGRTTLASLVFIGSLMLQSLPVIVLQPNISLIFAALPLIASGALLNRRGILAVALITLTFFFLRFSVNSTDRTPVRIIPAETVPDEIFAGLTVVVAGATFLILAGGSSSRIAAESEREVRQLELGASILSQASYSPEDLYAQMLALLERDLGYLQAQVYIVESSGHIVRRYRLSDAAHTATEPMRADEAIIVDTNLASEPAVEATQFEPRLITSRDGEAFSSHLIEGAEAAYLVPIVSGERSIGVLSVQAATRTMFTPTTRRALTTLCIGLAYRVNRLFDYQELLRNFKVQEDALLQARAQLVDVRDRASGGLLSRTSGRSVVGYDLVSATNRLEAEAGLSRFKTEPAQSFTPEIRAALARGSLHTETLPDGGKRLLVPIVLRGEVLGAMTFTLEPGQTLLERQLELVRAVANRLAVTIENSQLFEQSQAQTSRERKATEIATELLTVTDIDALLSLAASSFRDALGAVYTGVHIAPDAAADAAGSGSPLSTRRGTGALSPYPASAVPGNGAGSANGHGQNGDRS